MCFYSQNHWHSLCTNILQDFYGFQDELRVTRGPLRANRPEQKPSCGGLQMNQRTTIYRQRPDIVARQIVDEVILVPVRRVLDDVESIYTLNEVGARIWELIDGKRRVEEIRDLILAEFEVSQGEAEEDLLTLLQQFTEIGAISEVPTNDA